MNFSSSYGSEVIIPVIDRDATFSELVPNGDDYPSKGEWVVPYEG